MINRTFRASDADRECVVTILRESFAEGRLDLDEFDDRTSAAYAARTWGDLLDLTADLPEQPVLDGAEPATPAIPTLPPVRPAAIPPAMRPQSRRGMDGRLLPALFIWAVIAAAAGSPVVAGVLTVFFIGLLASRWAGRGR
jgi:hypothetical protein